MFGGAFVGGKLAPATLFHFKLESDDKIQWNEINTQGDAPGQRYGHSLCFNKPYVILFGGGTGQTTLNETWILNLLNSNFSWQKV